MQFFRVGGGLSVSAWIMAGIKLPMGRLAVITQTGDFAGGGLPNCGSGLECGAIAPC
jgi:hypothetical protein